MTEPDQISALINAIQAGDAAASDRLFGLLYEEFRNKAHVLLRVGPRQTLCTTELVNETWLRLHGRMQPVENRAHFCNLAARAMRQVLIDRARHRNAEKRGDGVPALTLCAADDVQGEDPFDVLALDQVMTALARVDRSLFLHDAAFFTTEARFTWYDELVAATLRAGIPLDVTMFGGQVMTMGLLLGAARRLLERSGAPPAAQWAGVVGLAVALPIPVAGTRIGVLEPYLLPRGLGIALAAWACVLAIDRRRGRS